MSCVMGLLSEPIAHRAALESLRITALVNFSKWHCSWDRAMQIAGISPSKAVLWPTCMQKDKVSKKIPPLALGLSDQRDPSV
ncbi:hypothetical protein TNIN_234121 [Trichonephila inaurata madagascariensis]|uniref:Uncharacterized protein n=1 Tax=Trichonephila inaurata madagascariensis TaxID=2747483 RepID=A0A8X6K759_9ARAC|nr:hypothetical protein TNIN_234121 [Trichonephila inaurata madagascariensis]